MMYIAGETQDVSTPTIKLIEDIIRDQVVHILGTAKDLATRRGSRIMSKNDIIFQVRHDVARTERIRTFLTWKAIRRTAKEAEDKDNLVEEADLDDADDAATAADDGPANSNNNRAKFATVSYPWDMTSYYADHVAHITPDDLLDVTSSAAALEKLRKNDERTRDMTVAEYATWSEYRHASLTYRKAKRFRDWCGPASFGDNKPSDDVLDILGFLTSEMVQNLTAEALRVQLRDMGCPRPRGAAADSEMTGIQNAKGGLFSEPEGVRKAIEGKHVRMAFQRLQERPKGRAFLKGARHSSSLSLL